MPVARVVNLTKAIESLKERGYYSVGLDGGGDALVGETGFETDPLVVVLGSEGNGLEPVSYARHAIPSPASQCRTWSNR